MKAITISVNPKIPIEVIGSEIEIYCGIHDADVCVTHTGMFDGWNTFDIVTVDAIALYYTGIVIEKLKQKYDQVEPF